MAAEPATRSAAWPPSGAHAAVVFGSGLAALPPGAVVRDELGYDELGWPCTAVPGHANRLLLAEVAGRRWRRAAPGAGLRPAAPLRRLGRGGARAAACATSPAPASRASCSRNSTGALRPAVAPGDVVVCRDVVDLQTPPAGEEPPV